MASTRESLWASCAELSSRTGLPSVELQRLADEGILSTRILKCDVDGRKRRHFLVGECIEFKNKYGNCHSAAIATQLGISVNQLHELLRHGFADAGGLGPGGRIPMEMVNKLIAVARRPGTRKFAKIPEDAVALSSIVTPGQRLFPHVATLIRAISDDKVQLRGVQKDAPGITGWIMNVDVVRGYTKRLVIKEEDEYSVTSAAQILRVRQPEVSHWCDLQLLPSYQKKSYRYIGHHDLENFQTRYITSKIIARACRLSKTRVDSMLRDAGLRPVAMLRRNDYGEDLYCMETSLVTVLRETFFLKKHDLNTWGEWFPQN